MKCQCGKEATFDIQFGQIKKYICEFCGSKFAYVDEGQATDQEINELRSAIMTRVVNHKVAGDYRQIVMRLSKGSGDSIKMYSPSRIDYTMPGGRRGGN